MHEILPSTSPKRNETEVRKLANKVYKDTVNSKALAPAFHETAGDKKAALATKPNQKAVRYQNWEL